MALRGSIEAQCPKGCPPGEAEVWSFIRGDKDAELRECILAGELNLLVCEDCGAAFYPEACVVYFDPAARLLAFVYPESYQPEEARWRQRMKEDCEQMRSASAESRFLEIEPVLLFGMEPLRDILQKDDDIEDEVRIAEILCREAGLTLLSVDRAWARERGLPWTLPCRLEGKKPTVASALAGVRALLKINDRLGAYERWLSVLDSEKSLPPLA